MNFVFAFDRIITEQKRAKAELESARDTAAAASQFLGNLSHEIRTPMNGFADVDALGTSALEGETTHGRITTVGDKESEDAPAASRLKILLAEDNAVNQRVAVRLLQKQGHTVSVAEHGREALRRLEQEHFDLVLMDVQMPEMDGIEATAAIRTQEQFSGQHLPIVAMTAHAMAGDRERCLGSGMDGYVSKPIQPKVLFDTIASLFAKSAAGAAAQLSIHSQFAAPTPTHNRQREHGLGTPSIGNPCQPQAFDHRAMVERLGDDLELVTELIDLFLEESPMLLADVQLAVNCRDAKAVERSAHRLKGSAGNFGMNKTCAAALRIEVLGRKGDLTDVDAAYQSLHDELRQLQAELAEWRQAESTTLLHERDLESARG